LIIPPTNSNSLDAMTLAKEAVARGNWLVVYPVD
jgi:hypothetical protein